MSKLRSTKDFFSCFAAFVLVAQLLGLGFMPVPLSLKGDTSCVAGEMLILRHDTLPQVKLLLQPLKGQDPSSGKQLCLLDFLSTPKQIRQHVVQTLLSKLAEISDPESSAAVQPSAAHAEALAPPVAEPSPRETFTEGTPQLVFSGKELSDVY